MEFAAANIWGDFHNASRTEQGTLDANANEVILGPKLNDAVKHWATGYVNRMDLGPDNKPMDERAELLDLRWGHVEHDGALYQGLGAAMTNFAEVLGANVTKLAESWSGDSYDAFKAAIDKIQSKLAEYGAAATTTGDGLVNAMGQIREMYQTFADDSAHKHLNFHPISPPEQWHKVGDEGYTTENLSDNCPTNHGGVVDYNWDCLKDNPEQAAMINGHWVTQRRWDLCVQDGCEESLDRVSIMYTNLVDQCQDAIDRIKGKLNSYYGAVKTTVDGVSELYGVALSNVYKLGHAEAFTGLRVIGGQPAGGPPPGGGDTGYPVDGGSYPAGGGDPGPAAATEPPPSAGDPVGTDPAAVETPPVDAAAQDSAATDDVAGQDSAAGADASPESAGPESDGESVRIKDGDRTIGVTSPDGEGHVKVTVEDGAGGTKTYSLDFNAASSGLPSDPEAGHIPARTDGKCVIEDGALTITAERPLFSPDSIKLVVDDGGGDPRTYTLDFEDQKAPDQGINGADVGAPADQDTDGASAAAPADEGVNGTPAPPAGEPAQLTSPQAAWHGDQRGSVSGVLVPDQPGEAELAKAPDDAKPEVGGMAGAGLPMMAAPAASGGGAETVRAGSGWSVHGDLFDNGGPVYSMHGVLGDDDAQE